VLDKALVWPNRRGHPGLDKYPNLFFKEKNSQQKGKEKNLTYLSSDSANHKIIVSIPSSQL
jgi:hypothetical protein